MQNFDHNATRFSAQNALLLARLCNAAYGTEAEARPLTEQMGFTDFRWVNLEQPLENTSALIVGCGDFAAIAFCGTKDLKNWMTDLHSTPGRFAWFFRGAPDIGEVHAGFAFALRHSWDKIVAAMNFVLPPVATPVGMVDGLSTRPQKTLWITGHSLGGALAALAGGVFSMLPERHHPAHRRRLYFWPAADRIAQFLRGLRPPPRGQDLSLHQPRRPRPARAFSRLELRRPWPDVHFDSNGKPQRESREWSNFLARTFEGFADFFQITTHFTPDVGDHSRQGYEQLVREHQGELDALFG